MTAEQLHDDIFYGRIKMCHQCRRRRESNCTNRECLKECEWMVKEKTRKGEMDEQLKLF